MAALAPPGYEKTVEAQRLLEQLRLIDAAIREAEARLRELEEAARVLEKMAGRGRVYRSVGNLMIEIGFEDAKRYVEDEKEILEARLQRLRREREQIEKRLRELLQGLGIGVGVSTALARRA